MYGFNCHVFSFRISHKPLKMPTTGLLMRGSVLFMIGVFFSIIFHFIQINRRHVTNLPVEFLDNLLAKEWWVPPCCGLASGMEEINPCRNIDRRTDKQGVVGATMLWVSFRYGGDI